MAREALLDLYFRVGGADGCCEGFVPVCASQINMGHSNGFSYRFMLWISFPSDPETMDEANDPETDETDDPEMDKPDKPEPHLSQG